MCVGINKMSDACSICGGLILEPNKSYGYSGPVCRCEKKWPPRISYNDYRGKINYISLEEHEHILLSERERHRVNRKADIALARAAVWEEASTAIDDEYYNGFTWEKLKKDFMKRAKEECEK